jgi:hypothetical protein
MMRFDEASSACNRKYCPERTGRGRRGACTDDERYGPSSLTRTKKVEGSIGIFVTQFFLSLLSRKPALRNVGNARRDDTS